MQLALSAIAGTKWESSGGKAGKRIAATALLGFSLCLAPAQAQEPPPLDRFRCETCDSYPEFRLGDFSRLEEPILDSASGSPFPNNVIPRSRLLAHGAWPEAIYTQNASVFRDAAERVAQRVAQGWTPLHEAVNSGSRNHPRRWLNPAQLDRLLDAWPGALNSGPRNPVWLAGRTPLHFAADWAYLRPGMVGSLLARGASVHAPDSRGYTPLLWANSREAFEALQAAGADIRAQDDDGFTGLCRAALSGDAAWVRELLEEEDFNPNAATDWGQAPLHYARSREVFKALRAAGVFSVGRQAKGAAPVGPNRSMHTKTLYFQSLEISSKGRLTFGGGGGGVLSLMVGANSPSRVGRQEWSGH